MWARRGLLRSSWLGAVCLALMVSAAAPATSGPPPSQMRMSPSPVSPTNSGGQDSPADDSSGVAGQSEGDKGEGLSHGEGSDELTPGEPTEDPSGSTTDGGANDPPEGVATPDDPIERTLEQDPGDPGALPAVAEGTRGGWKRPNISLVPVERALFNDASARANSAAATRTLRYVEKLVDLTPPGETIRVAQYNLARERTVEKLFQAHERGVNLQIIVNDRVLGNDVTRRTPYPRFRRALGTDISKPSFIVICDRGCRTRAGSALHIKFISISRVSTRDGDRRNILMTASGNLTGWAANRQYNDAYVTVGKAALVADFNDIFSQLARDRFRKDAFQRFDSGHITAWFFPRPGGTQVDDPVWQVLQGVRCRNAGPAGRNGRTVVRVKMFTWNGTRGLALARRLYELDQRGCDVQVVVGAPASVVSRELRRPGRNGGIKVWDSRVDRDGNGEFDLYTHMKSLQINGRIRRQRSVRHVYTGSANWTPDAYTRGDELVVRLTRRKASNQYTKNFNFVKERSRRMSNRSFDLAVVTPY